MQARRTTLAVAAVCSTFSFAAAADPITYSPAPLDAMTLAVQNPWSGLYEWNGQELLDLPNPAPDAYTRVTWRDFESAEGQYDFSTLEEKLNAAQGKGQKFSFRLRCMKSSGIEAPDYVEPLGSWDAGLWSPDWNNTEFLARYRALFEALGAEYDDDPRIGFIEIGNYGKWGEGHSPGPNPATDETKQELVDMVLDAFPHQRHVVMSDDDTMLFYALNKSPSIGWRRDSLGWEHFYQTPENKWADDPVKWALFTERWKTAPVVAEFAPWDDSNPTKAREGFFDRAMVGVERFHVTMMGNGNVPIDSSELTTEEVEGLSALHGSSGLRPRLKELELSAAETGTQTLTASWENLGSAPAYEAYEVRLALRDPETLEALWTSTSSLEMEDLLPTEGTPAAVVDTIVWPAALAGASLELTVQVMDPTGYRKPLFLLNEGREPDGAYLVGKLTLEESDVGVDAGDAGHADGAAGAAGHPHDAGAEAGASGQAGSGNLGATDDETDGCGCRTAPGRGDAGTRLLLPLTVALLLLRRRLLPNLHRGRALS